MLWQIAIFGESGVDPVTLTPVGFSHLVLKGFSMALFILMAICVVYIVMAGIQYITAAGNAGEQTNAKKTVTYALLGLTLALLSFVLVSEVLRRLGFAGSV